MTYYKLDENELNDIKKASKITLTDYDLEGQFIPCDALTSAIKDLLIEIDELEEKLDDVKRDLEENYKPIPLEEQYGISVRDFI